MRALGADVRVVSRARPCDRRPAGRAAATSCRTCSRDHPGRSGPTSTPTSPTPPPHAAGTMREIDEALDGDLDYLFVATSTTGTLRGCCDYLRAHDRQTRVVAVDAVGQRAVRRPHGRTRRCPASARASRRALARGATSTSSCACRISTASSAAGGWSTREAILAGGSSGGVAFALESLAPSMPAGSRCARSSRRRRGYLRPSTTTTGSSASSAARPRASRRSSARAPLPPLSVRLRRPARRDRRLRAQGPLRARAAARPCCRARAAPPRSRSISSSRTRARRGPGLRPGAAGLPAHELRGRADRPVVARQPRGPARPRGARSRSGAATRTRRVSAAGAGRAVPGRRFEALLRHAPPDVDHHAATDARSTRSRATGGGMGRRSPTARARRRTTRCSSPPGTAAPRGVGARVGWAHAAPLVPARVPGRALARRATQVARRRDGRGPRLRADVHRRRARAHRGTGRPFEPPVIPTGCATRRPATSPRR